MSRIRALLCAAMLLAACGSPGTRHSVPRAPAPADATAGAATAYRIDSEHSEIRLLVYRAGPMARFGHNHVIVNRAVSGWVKAADSGRAALFLRIPTAQFSVDEPDARASEGPQFAAPVPDDAKAGTRRNMLGAALLDADRFPDLTLSSVAVDSSSAASAQGMPGPGALVARMTVNVAGHSSAVTVPFTLAGTAERLTALGTLALKQSELGLTPFSVMLGALQVQDEITVKFTLVAIRG